MDAAMANGTAVLSPSGMQDMQGSGCALGRLEAEALKSGAANGMVSSQGSPRFIGDFQALGRVLTWMSGSRSSPGQRCRRSARAACWRRRSSSLATASR